MARSPLMMALRRALMEAVRSDDSPAGGTARRPRDRGWSRRAFAGLAASAPLLAARRKSPADPNIAIVGGGIAGLYAAWLLKRAGLRATVYESSNRTSGRMYSAEGVAAPGVVTELGGEFIDTSHKEILGLAKRFDLPLIDTHEEGESKLQPETFLFGGAVRKAAEVAAQFTPMLERLKADVETAGGKKWKQFDRLSIAQYLDQIGASGWARALLDVAYRTEYGMDTGEQSALNLLWLFEPLIEGDHIHLFGESDERYKILGGNQRVPDAVASQIRDQILLEHRLESIRPADKGFQLTFQKSGGGAVEVSADVVLLTIPFTILRRIELRVKLPAQKLRAIRDLGYGTNAKLFFGFERRLWREQGFAGTLFTDTDCQLVWDSSRLQNTTNGALTMLMGGAAGVKIGTGSPEEHEKRLMPEVEKVWTGVGARRTGAPKRFHWPSHPHTRAAYASYKVGQWTELRGHEFAPVGNLYFAGEHCSLESQGYMEGGAETGRRAAEAIARRAGKEIAAG